jgi:hypothetical protein
MSVYVQGYSQTLGTKAFDAASFSIYPNPVNNIATIDAKGQDVKSVAVINTLGQTVMQGTSDKVDMSSLQKGIYMLQVEFTNNQTATKKIIKN